MPTRSDWILFEGRHATKRGAAMVQEARRLFTKRTGLAGPAISQGGKSYAAASSNTHAREGFDFRTAHLSTANCRIFEECLWAVGFAAWWRPYVRELWPQHHHAIPKGGDLSQGAAYQVSAFKAGRNGLKSNLRYPRIGNYAFRTWEGYLKTRPKPAPALPKIRVAGRRVTDIPYVSLEYLREAWNRPKAGSKNVYWVQTWLKKLGYYREPVDGLRGQKTWEAWQAFLIANRLKDPGLPNWDALSLLARKARTTKRVQVSK